MFEKMRMFVLGHKMIVTGIASAVVVVGGSVTAVVLTQQGHGGIAVEEGKQSFPAAVSGTKTESDMSEVLSVEEGAKVEQVANEDGTVTEVITHTDGTVTEVTTHKDGSQSVTVTNEQGHTSTVVRPSDSSQSQSGFSQNNGTTKPNNSGLGSSSNSSGSNQNGSHPVQQPSSPSSGSGANQSQGNSSQNSGTTKPNNPGLGSSSNNSGSSQNNSQPSSSASSSSGNSGSNQNSGATKPNNPGSESSIGSTGAGQNQSTGNTSAGTAPSKPAAPAEFDANKIINAAVPRIKEFMTYLPDLAEEMLESGQITQQEYEEGYPTYGSGYLTFNFELNETPDEIVQGLVDIYRQEHNMFENDYFYIEYLGKQDIFGTQKHVFKLYR